jgi:hypothetical protein
MRVGELGDDGVAASDEGVNADARNQCAAN